MSRRTRIILLCAILLAVSAAVFLFVPRIAQDPAYHRFADSRTVFGIPNAWNVLSNLGFLLAGIWGLLVLGDKRIAASVTERLLYAIFFFGVVLTCFGSGYYHLAPDNARLVWDRLPMTIGFVSFMAAMVGERIGEEMGKRMLFPLLALGVISVLYWRWTETRGVGDLRFYGLVQFLPILAIPLLVLFFPPKYSGGGYLFGLIGLYVLAKVFEAKDAAVFSATGAVSGHALKHLAAAVAVGAIIRMLQKRKIVTGLRRR
jgi:hypothetical protein